MLIYKWLNFVSGFYLLGVNHKESTLIAIKVNRLSIKIHAHRYRHICWPQLISECSLLNECALVILDLVSDCVIHVSILSEETHSCFFPT